MVQYTLLYQDVPIRGLHPLRGKQKCRGRSPLPGTGERCLGDSVKGPPVFPPTIPLKDAKPKSAFEKLLRSLDGYETLFLLS